jgi:RNA polymerase sigma factor (sigma-70 family)
MRKITDKDVRIVKKIASKYPGYSWDDLVGEGCIGLINGLRKFNGDKTHEFRYIYASINNAMLNYIKKRNNHDNHITCEYMEDTLDCVRNPEETMIRKEMFNKIRAQTEEILLNLTEREQYVLFCHVLSDESETLRCIAVKWDCSKDSILRDKKRVLRQFNL